MAETKNWTPGPWAIDGWHTSAVIAKLPDESYVRVADCDTPSFPNLDWKANAHLIAAAPAMYEALRNAAEWLNDMSCEHGTEQDDGMSKDCVVCQVNAALAQAEGR